MARSCTVCSHPKRNEIDRALADPGCVKRDVARRYDLNQNSLGRHVRRHLPRRLAAAATNGHALSSRSLLDRVLGLVDKLEALLHEGGGVDVVLDTAAQLRPTLELLGRVTREIQPESAIQVTIGLFQRLGVSDEDELQRKLSAVDEYAGLPEPEVASRMAAWLGRYLAANPGERERLAAVVGQRIQEWPQLAPQSQNGGDPARDTLREENAPAGNGGILERGAE